MDHFCVAVITASLCCWLFFQPIWFESSIIIIIITSIMLLLRNGISSWQSLSSSFIAVLLLLLLVLSSTRCIMACTDILVTPGASVDGSAMIAYNADSPTLFGSLYHYPATMTTTNDENTPKMRQIYNWDTGVRVQIWQHAWFLWRRAAFGCLCVAFVLSYSFFHYLFILLCVADHHHQRRSHTCIIFFFCFFLSFILSSCCVLCRMYL